MAKTVRPKSLRAVYGKDKGKNGVHCTDLPEDGVLEVEYFFNILQKKWNFDNLLFLFLFIFNIK